MELKEKISKNSAYCAVIGLGYVGLPLLVEFAKASYKCVGIDIDAAKTDSIMRGESYIQDVSSDELKKMVDSGLMTATTDYSVIKDVDIVSICVPTPLRKSKTPDISYIVDACAKVSRYMHKGQLVILESTTYPGSTEEIVLPILSGRFQSEDYAEICEGKVLSETDEILADRIRKTVGSEGSATVLKAGEDFFLAFSPERVDPGNERYKTKDIPKVIGGATAKCSELSSEFYSHMFPQVVTVSSTRAAEMVKLLENTFRSVNIALANEMLLMCDSLNVDIWEIIDAAATKPFGFMPFYPGPGLGGHCIPIDPLYLTWKAKMHGVEPKFVELASEINRNMPEYVVSKVQDRLNEVCKSLKDSNIIIIGVAYKKDVSDIRESPALEIISLLKEKGANVTYHDPYVSNLNSEGMNIASVELSKENLKQADGIVIASDHSNIDYQLIVDNCAIIIDTRNALGKLKK
ncbi:nucleotide sugar dehydrogenase [Elusimicrobiota bacterium]